MSEHTWERFDGFFNRCQRCGWGWKVGENNNFPCPGKTPPFMAQMRYWGDGYQTSLDRR